MVVSAGQTRAALPRTLSVTSRKSLPATSISAAFAAAVPKTTLFASALVQTKGRDWSAGLIANLVPSTGRQSWPKQRVAARRRIFMIEAAARDYRRKSGREG